MEVTLVHPDAPDFELKANNPIELSAYKQQGFVEKDMYLQDQAQTQTSENAQEEVKSLQQQLDDSKAESNELKEQLTEVKNQLKAERAKNTREANKAAKDEEVTDPQTTKVEDNKGSENE